MIVDVPGEVPTPGLSSQAGCAKSDQMVSQDRTAWLARAKAWQKKYPVILPEYWNYTDGVSNYVLVEVLSQEMEEGDLLIPGSSGACSEITMQAFPAKRGVRSPQYGGPRPHGLRHPGGHRRAGLASDRRRTRLYRWRWRLCHEQPGNSRKAVRRLALPIKDFFVLNNEGYASIRSTQRGYFGGHFVASDPSSGLTLPDTRKIAEAYGLPFLLIRNHDELRSTIRSVLDAKGPVLCEVPDLAAAGHGTTTLFDAKARRIFRVEAPGGSFSVP